MSSLEVDPSPLAFAPWSLKYFSKNLSSLDKSSAESRSTSLKITIDNKNEKRSSQKIDGVNLESNIVEKENWPPTPTLSILVEESSEKGLEQNDIVQVEVHRQDIGHLEMEMDNDFGAHNTEDPSENKHYLKLPSVLFGYFQNVTCLYFLIQ